MYLWTDSERNWALKSESKPEIEKNIFFIKLSPIKLLKTLFPLEDNKLFSCGQSIQFYKNKCISGLIRNGIGL